MINTMGGTSQASDSQRIIHSLNALAVNGLLSMYAPERRLFCFRLKRTAAGMVREGVSPRYTAIALMGLHRLEQSGAASPIEIKPVFDLLSTNTDWIDNIGDLGLLLWLCALVAPDCFDKIDRRLDVQNSLVRFRDARLGRTIELSCLLAGLSHQALSRPRKVAATKTLAVEICRRLRMNQGEEGLFGHIARNNAIAAMMRRNTASFADQAFPIYALAKFSQAYGDDRAIAKAVDCALTLCESQGPLGQWWWNYDSSNGEITERFPVFSVHQHGMGPMALFALGEAIHSDFSPWVYKGLQWIEDNELGIDMQDNTASVVWRCVERGPFWRFWDAATSLVTRRRARKSCSGLRPQFECRPYELGWLLYALADQTNECRRMSCAGWTDRFSLSRPN